MSNARYLRGDQPAFVEDELASRDAYLSSTATGTVDGALQHADLQPPPLMDGATVSDHHPASASWGTKRVILTAEALVVTAITFFILLSCFVAHRRRLLAQKRAIRESIQEWATIRIDPAARARMDSGLESMMSGSRNGNASSALGDNHSRRRLRVDSGIGGMSVGSREGGQRVAPAANADSPARSQTGAAGGQSGRRADSVGIGGMSVASPSRDGGRVRVDSNVSGIMAPSSAAEGDATANAENDGGGGEGDRRRTRMDRILSAPRAVGRFLFRPMRMLEEGINNWATENQDEIFLRTFMENLEREREAARENPQARERRLKEAFDKACMVWELDDEHFVPPKALLELAELGAAERVMKKIDSDFSLYTLGEAAAGDENGLLDGVVTEEEVAKPPGSKGVSSDANNIDCRGKTRAGSEMKEGEVGTEKKVTADPPTDPESEAMDLSVAPTLSATSSEESAPTTEPMAPSLDEEGKDDATSDPSSTGQLSTSPLYTDEPTPDDKRPRSNSAPSLATAADDTFDSEVAPEFLYLNCLSRKRQRANTGSSANTDFSSLNDPTTMSNAESMDSFASASSSSQDSYKIPNECAICLCEYDKGDVVVTSCNDECPHAFHRECIVEWLVKMQEGTPCPCCRRQFVELDDPPPRTAVSGNSASRRRSNTDPADATATLDPEEAERRRREDRRRSIELGIRRGQRTFNTSVINVRSSTSEERQQRREHRRRMRYVELRRRDRAFDTSVVSFR